MITASQIRAGMAIRYQDQSYKVIAADYHPGQGKMGGVNHLRLRNLSTGTFWEHSLRADLKIEELLTERRALEFLYRDGDTCFFMDPQSYDQIEVPSAVIGEQVKFLEPSMQLPVDFVEGRAISVVFPDFIETRIADTAPPLHGQADSAWKSARLSNDVEIMVPPFVKTGDIIRLNLTDLKYMDRAKAKTS
ncbi:MAG: elongation factor P [Acidobacteriaceae bacterium]|nr:elongation factor P [Acidobacteriaceae bacterium]